MVPRWVRGRESAELLLPTPHRINLLGLGGSVGTPEGGLTADVVVVGSFDELDMLGDAAKGKIVLFDVPTRAMAARWSTGMTAPRRLRNTALWRP